MHKIFPILLAGVLTLVGCGTKEQTAVESKLTLTNASYDPTRELYKEFNAAFAEHYKAETGKTVTVEQTHAGSSAQARAVIGGLAADVVTLALAYDIDNIAEQTQALPREWQARLPHNSTPYTSTVVFLVRKGNPKGIRGWDDLLKPGVEIVVAHPKTSGVARWAYLAGWGYVLKKELGDLKKIHDPAAAEEVAAAQKKAQEFITALYKNVINMPTGARGASQAFVQQGTGDVLLDWENQAELTINEFGKGDYDIVVPSISILAEPPVALIDKNAEKHGVKEIAEAYLQFLYSPQGQDMVAKHHYRPSDPEVMKKYSNTFKHVETFTIDDVFGGWQKAQKEHFDDGGVFDKIYTPAKK